LALHGIAALLLWSARDDRAPSPELEVASFEMLEPELDQTTRPLEEPEGSGAGDPGMPAAGRRANTLPARAPRSTPAPTSEPSVVPAPTSESEPTLRPTPTPGSVVGGFALEKLGGEGGVGRGGRGGGRGRGIGGRGNGRSTPLKRDLRRISRARPARLIYPKRSRPEVPGEVFVVLLTVDADGYVDGVRLRKGVNPHDDSKALEAVWRFRYAPALDDGGRPITSKVVQRFMLER
jgi:hypothetical protein